MPPTIKDVARRAGVSTATVSLVTHNHKRISPATRKRVLSAITELNYRPSRLARGLVMRKTGNIGFLLTNDHFLRTEPFYTHIFLGSEFEARDHEYYILVNTIQEEFNACDNLPRFVLENNVDGIIIAGKVPYEIIPCLEACNLPLVFVDYYPPAGEYSAVLIDNENGGMQATEHLISHGHRKIGFIGGDMKHPSIRDRFLGYQHALQKAGIEIRQNRIFTTETATNRQSGFHAARELLKDKYDLTAIFACNDAMALGALQFIKEKGLSVPGDISIVGFDDVTADIYSEPQLTSVQVPKVELGAEAMRTLLGVLNNKEKANKKILIPVKVVARNSVADAA